MAAGLFGAAVIGAGSGSGAFIIFSERDLAVAAGTLAFALVLGLVMLIRDRAVERGLQEAAGVNGEVRRLQLSLERLGHRLDDVMIEPRQSESPAERPLVAELEELRHSLSSFAAEHGVEASPPVKPSPVTVAALDHKLELTLEPIVALASGRTVHYRAAIVFEARDGRHVPYEELSRRINAHALRPSLDIHCLSRVLPLTRKLVLRRQSTLIFVPIGGETLASADAMMHIEDLLTSDEGFASAIAFEIDHKTMPGLSAQGVEGLATLARYASGMALTRIAPQGVDLAALRDLRFAFLCFPAANLPRSVLGKPDWSSLAGFAAEHGFKIEVRGLDNAAMVAKAKTWASLGSGLAFAPPRRVKNEEGAAGTVRAAA